MRLRNGVWVHELEYEALRGLVATCRSAVDAKTPGTAEWNAVRDALYQVMHVWLDIEDADRAIRDLIKIEHELSEDEA